MKKLSGVLSEECEGKYLTFSLSHERYGLKITSVQEIIGIPNVTRVPKCPDYLKGVINLRGKIVPLIDLRLKFGMSAALYDEKTCIAVVNIRKEDQNVLVGVIVDTVLEVINFNQEDIQPAPNYAETIDASSIIGMARKSSGDLNILLDIEKALMTIDINSKLIELN